MPYNQNIPQATDQQDDSQLDLLNNFQALYTFLDENHAIFGDPNEGKHKYVTLPEQGAAPATAANEMAVYTKQSTLTGNSAMFVRDEGSGTEVEFTSSLAAVNGWTRLPSGILLKWGTTNATGLTTVVYPVAANIPVFTAVYNILLSTSVVSAIDANAAINLATIGTVLDFDVYASSRTLVVPKAIQFNYLSIGI